MESAHQLRKIKHPGEMISPAYRAGIISTIAVFFRYTALFEQLGQDALDWIKTNFYKSELELGHCLRLPQEGPCECNLYLTCAKFVTTPQYAPHLRDRLLGEQLADDAQVRGWDREADRHQRTADRIRSLLSELGEPSGRPEDTH